MPDGFAAEESPLCRLPTTEAVCPSGPLTWCCVARCFAGDWWDPARTSEPRGPLAAALNARRREVLNEFRATLSRMEQHACGEESSGPLQESGSQGDKTNSASPPLVVDDVSREKGGEGAMPGWSSQGGSSPCGERTQELLDHAEAGFSLMCLKRLCGKG